MAHFSRRVVATVLGALSLLALAPWPGATAGPVPAPRSYYVATNGNDSPPGTEPHPFRSARASGF